MTQCYRYFGLMAVMTDAYGTQRLKMERFYLMIHHRRQMGIGYSVILAS